MPLDAKAVVGVDERRVVQRAGGGRHRLPAVCANRAHQAGRRDHVAGAIDDGGAPGAADLQRGEKAGQRLQRDIDAEHAIDAAGLLEADRRRDARRLGGEEDIRRGPVNVLGLQRALIPDALTRVEVVQRVGRAVHHLPGRVQVHGRDLARIRAVEDQLGVGAAGGVATHHGEIAVTVGDIEALQVRHLVEHAGGESLDRGLAVRDGVARHHVAGDQRRLGRRVEVAADLAGDARLQRVQHRLRQHQGAGPVRLVAV